jgi:hypothetical protein
MRGAYKSFDDRKKSISGKKNTNFNEGFQLE